MKNNISNFAKLCIIAAIGAFVAAAINGCNQPSATHPILPGNEQLTTTFLVYTDQADTTVHDTAFRSQFPPQFTDTAQSFLRLKAGHTYSVRILIVDSTQAPGDSLFNVTNQIQIRKNYHLFCFTTYENLNLTVTRLDYDNNMPPLQVGLLDQIVCGNASSGQLEIVLHHQPDVKNGQCAPGSIDEDVFFNVIIQ